MAENKVSFHMCTGSNGFGTTKPTAFVGNYSAPVALPPLSLRVAPMPFQHEYTTVFNVFKPFAIGNERDYLGSVPATFF